MAVLRNVRRLLAVLILGGLLGCHQDQHPPPDHNDRSGAVDTAAQLDQLEQLGNIAYDHPERFIHDPDSFLNQLTTLPVTAEGKEMYVWLLLNIGYALRESGNVPGSTRYYEMALEYIDDNRLPEPDFVDYIAKPLGNLYTQLGDLQRALYIHERAIDTSKQRGKEQQLPSLYTNLAVAYQQLGWPERVLDACKSGLQYVSDRDANAGLLYNILANCYQTLGQLDTARYYNQLAIHHFTRKRPVGDTLIWYTSALYQGCSLNEAQDRLDDALQQINSAILLTEQHFPGSKQRERAKYRYARGNLRFVYGDYIGAHKDFRDALQLFGDTTAPTHYPDYTFTEILWGLARVYAQQDADSAIQYYRRAIENAFYTQQLIVSDASHYQNSAWNRRLLDEAMGQLWAAFQSTNSQSTHQALVETMCWVTELSKGRQLLHEINRTGQWISDEGNTTRRSLQYLFQALATERNPTERQRLQDEADRLTFQFQLAEDHLAQSFHPPDFTAFIAQLTAHSDSTMWVSYFTSPESDGYYMAFTAGKAIAGQLPADALQAIQRFSDRYFGMTPTAYDNDPSRYRDEATRLAVLLLPALPAGGGRMVLSPDGPLLKLPFDALMEGDQFIGQRFTLNYTYTFLLNTSPKETISPPENTHRNLPLHVFAKSQYSGEELPDIPFVNQEVAYLSGTFGAAVYQDADASDTVLFGSLENGGLIHIAAHAVANGIDEPYIAFDQPVTLSKLQYTRATAPLVFLSACQTAAGELLRGEGVESLNRAFLSKGVRGVIASYWPVDDETTAVLARLFYDALTRTHEPALALAEAKRDYIASAPISAQNPWYWSSLQFTGVSVPTYLQKKSRWQYGLYVGLALTAIGCIAWSLQRRSKKHPPDRKYKKAN